MDKTLKILSTLITQDVAALSLEQLAENYLPAKNPSIFASAYKKTYRLAIHASSHFFGFAEEDKVSFILEELDKALQTYSAGKQSAFSTYFVTLLNNRLRMESQALSTAKRKAFLHADSYEAALENGFDIVSPAPDSMQEVVEALGSLGLTKQELQYCQLLMLSYKNSEIASMLQVSVMTLSNMRKKLRIKLSPLHLQIN